jgi:ketosteroid isomerase-like protein
MRFKLSVPSLMRDVRRRSRDAHLMTKNVDSNAQLVRDYLAALQSGDVGQSLARFFTSDATQVELPNRLNPSGQTSDLSSLMARSTQGQSVLSSQRYDVVSLIAQGESVAVEAQWVGVLAVRLGALGVGSEMRAHFAMFFECRDGRIYRQRNYDCFEPW